MNVPYHSTKYQYVYGWPWPAFKVTICHWPNFSLSLISQVIMVLGSSKFAWLFPSKKQNFWMCYSWPWPIFKVTRDHLPNFALCFISQVIMELGSSSFAWSFPSTKQSFSIWIVWINLTYFQGHYLALSFIFQVNIWTGSFKFCMGFSMCIVDLALLSRPSLDTGNNLLIFYNFIMFTLNS